MYFPPIQPQVVYFAYAKDSDGSMLDEVINPLAQGFVYVEERDTEEGTDGYLTFFDKAAAHMRTIAIIGQPFNIKTDPEKGVSHFEVIEADGTHLTFEYIDNKIYHQFIYPLLLDPPDLSGKKDSEIQTYLLKLNAYQ